MVWTLFINKFEELGIRENTIIFFLSDNGGPEEVTAADNDPLREGKGSFLKKNYELDLNSSCL